jgi:hypothetical protein
MSASPTIFLSYARQDQHCAERLAVVLSARGLSVWWDRNIRAGRSYERVIEEALTEAQIVVVLWSRSSVESDWVRAEASYALDANKLLPLNIDGTRLPLRFRPVQTISLTSWNEAQDTPEWALLFEEIDERLASPDEQLDREQEARQAEEARQRAEQERAELEARNAEEACREAERLRQAEEAARREQEAHVAEEARQRAEQERAEFEARKAKEARREAERLRQAEEAARREQEARVAEEARQRAEQERAELEAQKAEEARRETQRNRKPAEQPHTDQLLSQEQQHATATLPLTLGKPKETDNRVGRRKVANSNLLRISIGCCAAAILIFLVLSKTDYSSRWVVALGGAVVPPTPSPADRAPGAVVTRPTPEPVKPLPIAPPPEAAAPNPAWEPRAPPPEAVASNPASEPTLSTPAAPASPVEAPPNPVSEPGTLPSVASTSEIAADTSPPKPVAPSLVPAPEKVATAIPGPALASEPEPAAPPAEIATAETSFRTIFAAKLRAQPDKSARPLRVLEPGTEVTIIGKGADGDWYKVKLANVALEGFVPASTVRETSVLEAAEWQRIEKRDDAASFASFLRQYPRGAHAQAASARLGTLRVQHPPSETLSSGRCAAIIERSQLGEPVSDADRAILQNNCH